MINLYVLISGILILNCQAAPPLDGTSGMMSCITKNCDLDSGPVCTIGASGIPRTFESQCMADLAFCKFGIYYAVVKAGEC